MAFNPTKEWGESLGSKRRPRSCRDAIVAVMQAADFWNGDNATG